MRIGCLQFAPQVGDVDDNLNRADAILNKANPENLDLLVLPEMAFSGYNFKSLRDISPYLEPTGAGITSVWARTTALKHNCKVIVGYPEAADVSDRWPTSLEYYNSAIIVNEEGDTCGHYRKSHLYYTDESWALEGSGFFKGSLNGIGQVAMGICMDINPYKFEAPWNAYEFAFHVLDAAANVVILSMAWLTREDAETFCSQLGEPDMETMTYWITRLEPLIRAENEAELIVIFANRTGIEDDAVYAGTSAVLGIQNGEVTVYGMLGRGVEDLLVVDTTQSGFAKLVYRPDGDTHEMAATIGGETDHKPSCDSSNGGFNSPSLSTGSPSHPRGHLDAAAGPNSNVHRSPTGHVPVDSAAIPVSNACIQTSMDTESRTSPQFLCDQSPSELVDSDTTGHLFRDKQTSAVLRNANLVDHEAARSGGRVDESNAGVTSPSGKHRRRQSPMDTQYLPENVPPEPIWNVSEGSDTYQNMGNSKVSSPLKDGHLPDLERLGADLMIFEGERASRSKRDSLICHVDEDDFIVLRRDSVPKKEKQGLGERMSRTASRQRAQFRDDTGSPSMNKSAASPSTYITEPLSASSLRSGVPEQMPKSYSHGYMTSQAEVPTIGSPHHRKGESTYSPTNYSSPSRKVASSPLPRAHQVGEGIDSKRGSREDPVDKHAILSRTLERSKKSRNQQLAVGSTNPADIPILFSIDSLNTHKVSVASPPGDISMLKSGLVVKEKVWGGFPPTPKAMVFLPKNDD